nr:innexin [Anisakis simplex]
MMIESLIAMVRYLSPRQDDDAIDRLHYLYTPNILLTFAVLISFKQFGGRPLECMFPNKFPGSWEQYAENYCWAQDTYYVQPDVHVANIRENERYTPERQLSYYKWVPFFLLLEAALFRIPSIIWKYLSMSSGIRIHECVEKAMDPGNMDELNKERNIASLSRHMQNALRFHRRIIRQNIEVHKTFKFLNIRYSAFFISLMYLVTKSLYLINVLAQLYLMNKFLHTDRYDWYGIGVVRDILNGTEWSSSGYFPRVSLCDFMVRQVGNIQRYSVQCVLVINMFNEKIFILLWFWFMMLAVCTVLSFIYWFFMLTFPCFSRWFISQSLELSEMKFDPETRSKEVERFVSTYLHRDGVFVLRMVTIHAGIIFGSDLVRSLWRQFYGIEEQLSEGRTSKDDKADNQENFLRKRKKQRELVVDLDSYTALIPTSPEDSQSPKTPSDD